MFRYSIILYLVLLHGLWEEDYRFGKLRYTIRDYENKYIHIHIFGYQVLFGTLELYTA